MHKKPANGPPTPFPRHPGRDGLTVLRRCARSPGRPCRRANDDIHHQYAQSVVHIAAHDAGRDGHRHFCAADRHGQLLSGVTLNQGWTVNGLAFQGIFLEAPTITSSTDIKIYSNDLNWSNFSVLPDAPVHVWRLTRDAGGNSTYLFADLAAPHLNTYSVLVEAAANGQCWICLVNPQPVDMSAR